MKDLFAALIVTAVIATMFTLVGAVGYERGYERGQIDAMTGRKIHYYLNDREDGTRRWEYLHEPTTRPAMK